MVYINKYVKPTKVFKYLNYLFVVAIAMGVILLPMMPENVTAMVYVVPLRPNSGGSGYVGSQATITVGVTVFGATFSVSVTVSGADAYDAAAAVLAGVYDAIRGKYIALSAGAGYRSKSWCGLANWECYTISFNSGASILSANVIVPTYQCTSPSVWINISALPNPVVVFDVTHSTWWGLFKTSWQDVYPLPLSASVPCYSVT